MASTLLRTAEGGLSSPAPAPPGGEGGSPPAPAPLAHAAASAATPGRGPPARGRTTRLTPPTLMWHGSVPSARSGTATRARSTPPRVTSHPLLASRSER